MRFSSTSGRDQLVSRTSGLTFLDRVGHFELRQVGGEVGFEVNCEEQSSKSDSGIDRSDCLMLTVRLRRSSGGESYHASEQSGKERDDVHGGMRV